MGQMVSCVEKPSPIPGVVRFETNRTFTGQGHERYNSAAESIGPQPAAELARRMFSTGQVVAVHAYSNIVTVNLAPHRSADGLGDIVRGLYQYWKPGMEPAVFEAPDEAAPAATGAAPGGAEGAATNESAYTRLVPASLVERSQAALAKWKATHGG